MIKDLEKSSKSDDFQFYCFMITSKPIDIAKNKNHFLIFLEDSYVELLQSVAKIPHRHFCCRLLG